MSETFACPQCKGPLAPGDSYCARCGRPSSLVVWSLSATQEPGRTPVRLRPGETFFVVAVNLGLSPVRVEVDTERVRGTQLVGVASGFVAPRQSVAFAMQHRVGEDLGGVLAVRSRDGMRPHWWERAGWRQGEFRLPGDVRVREERWVAGSRVLLFPPEVRQQILHVWNDAEQERTFASDVPAGYRLLTVGNPADRTLPRVGGGQALELVLQIGPRGQSGSPDTVWNLGPEETPVRLLRMESGKWEAGADAVVALDFGTRNTGVRVRWRRTLVAAKPEGTTDVIGDRSGSSRFPTEMVAHKRDRYFLWGTEAAAAIQGNRVTPEEFAVTNLKTHLREGTEPFLKNGEEWTTRALLTRYFARIIERLDAYLASADPASPLSRNSLRLRYVLTRPTLDANEGDVNGRRYEEALVSAMETCGVDRSLITVIHEPVAAAIGIAHRREQELLALEGQSVAVIDAGGGTTDVALARVRLRDGRITLDITGSYAVWLNPENAAHVALRWYQMAERTEVGGNVLDCVLAYQLMAAAPTLLETEGKPLPRGLDFGVLPDATGKTNVAARQRESLLISRRMKERFAQFSRQYLNRSKAQPPAEGEVFPFPNRPEYEGIYLEHALVDENLWEPILKPVIAELSDRMRQEQQTRAGQDETESVLPSEVRKVFYVGGTTIDGFVRQHFGRAFPTAPQENDAGAQSEERIAERLHAVVEGAIWFDEKLFTPAPFALTVQMGDREEKILTEGAPILPAGMSPPRFLTGVLEPQEEMEARLIASGERFPGPLCVATGFYRNTTDRPQEVTLRVMVSRERGATATLTVGGQQHEQWRLALQEAAR